MNKLDRNFEILILVEILYEKEFINRVTYLNIMDNIKGQSKHNAA